MARGDRLESQRRILGSTVTYMHVGIDLGDGTVVHARPDDFRHPFGGGRIERTTLERFASGAAVRVVLDPPAEFSPDEVATRALAAVGREGYCPVVDNCEHFATWCATGRRASHQVDIVAGRIAAAAARVVAAVSAGAAGTMVVRTAAGMTVRAGLGGLLPASIVAEATAAAVEWRARQRGLAAAESRRAGDAAGLAASAATLAVAGLRAGPAGAVAGALAGAALWAAGGSLMSGSMDRGAWASQTR
jgi:hypothetical protein